MISADYVHFTMTIGSPFATPSTSPEKTKGVATSGSHVFSIEEGSNYLEDDLYGSSDSEDYE